jgi:hypothetical protein
MRVRMPVQNCAVIARLDRAFQYAATSRACPDVSGILDPRLRGDDEWGRVGDEQGHGDDESRRG